MTISLIAVVDSQMGLGFNGDQLIYISEDLKRFKAITTGHTIVMGRKTYEALPKGLLSKRRNIVLTRNRQWQVEKGIMANSVEEVLTHCSHEEEIFVIGGGEIYEMFLPLASKVYLTHIQHAFAQTDTYFPKLPTDTWLAKEKSEWHTDAKSGLQFCYVDYVRRHTTND